HPELPGDRETFTWQILQEREGYGWIFPKGNQETNLGVFTLAPAPLRELLVQFKRQHAVTSPARTQFGGRFPRQGPIRRTAADALVCCGDAAGMVFAATGEGIRYALASGQMAGDAMATALHQGKTDYARLRSYEHRWQQRFGRELRVGVQALDVLRRLRRSGHLELALRHCSDQTIAEFMLGHRWLATVLLARLTRLLGCKPTPTALRCS
ncbi:MAG: hypothetical protein K1X74_17185, partial [Pirellulales bacterium]|nr:hypothetical protein [Pirellulales bacterium]